MIEELTQWLREQLDADERRAQDGYYSDTHWERFTTDAHLGAWQAWRQRFPREQWDVNASDAISEAARDAIRKRITAHEGNRTSRALAEVAAKRRIMKAHERLPDGAFCITCDAPSGIPGEPYGCTTLRLLALPYADHPGYREEWRP